MAAALPDLTARIRVDTSDLDAASGRAGGILGKIGGAAGAVGLAVGAAFAGFAAVGVKGASDVEGGLREVVTLLGETGDAAANSLQGFQRDTAALSNEFGIAQETLTGGLYQAISAGVPKENAFEFLQVASKAGIAGVADTETAVDGLTTTINAFGLDIGQSQAVADSMFAAVKGGKTTFGELASSMSNVAPSAAAAGVSFQEVNAAIATMTAAGVPTSVATTQIRAALDGLQKPSEDLDKIFQSLGYTNAQTAIQSEGLGFALNAVKEASGGSNGKLQQLLGSSEAVSAANILAGTSAEKFSAEMDRQANAAGSVDDAFAVMSEGVGFQMGVVKTRLENAAIAFGTILLPAIAAVLGVVGDFANVIATNLVPFIQSLTPHFQAVGAAAQEMAAFIQENSTVFSIVGGLIAAVFIPHLVALGLAAGVAKVKVVAAWIATAAKAVWAAAVHSAQIVGMIAKWVLLGVQSLIAAGKVAAAWLISMGPIAIVIAAVIGLVVLIVKNFDTIKETIGRAWEWVKDATSRAWDAIKNALSAAWEAVKVLVTVGVDAVKTKITGAWDAIKNATDAAWEAVKAAISRAWDAVKGTVTGAVDAVRGAITGAWDAVTGATDRAWEAVKGAVSTAINAVVDYVAGMPGRFIANLSALGGLLADLGRRAFGDLLTAVDGGASGVLKFIAGMPARFVSNLGNLGSLLVGAGGDLLRGLASGISGAVGAVVEKAKAAARAVVNGVKSALGISSPSRVMAREVGVPMAEGIAVGIERSQGLVRDALDGAVAVPDVRGVVGAGVSAYNTPTGLLDPAVAPSGAGDGGMVALLDEVRALRDEVRRQTDRHLLWTRTAEVGVGG